MSGGGEGRGWIRTNWTVAMGHEFTLPISEFTITRQAKSAGRSVFEDGVTDPNGPAIRRVVGEVFEKTARPHPADGSRAERPQQEAHPSSEHGMGDLLPASIPIYFGWGAIRR